MAGVHAYVLGADRSEIEGVIARSESGCTYPLRDNGLQLLDAMRMALCESHRLEAADSSVASARASVFQARASYYPIVTASGSRALTRNHTDAEDQSRFDADILSEAADAELSLRMLLYDFGHRRALLNRAHAGVDLAISQRQVDLVRVLSDVGLAFHEVARALAARGAAHAAVERANRLVKVVGERVEAGAAAALDESRIRVAALRASIRKSSADRDLDIARDALASLLGVTSPPEVDVGSSTVSDWELNVPEFSDLQAANDQGSEVVLARKSYEVAKKAFDVVMAEGLPVISLRAAYSRTSSDVSRLGNIFGPTDIPANTRRESASVRLVISIPVFDGFDQMSARRKGTAEIRAAEARLKEAIRQYDLRLQAAYERFRSEAQSVSDYAMLSSAASEVADGALRRYRLGAATIEETLEAEKQLEDAELELVESLARSRRFRLELALLAGLPKSIPLSAAQL